MIERRAFLAMAGAGLGAAYINAGADELGASHAHATRGDTPPPLEVFTPEQAADIEAIAAQIIPTDDLPGAREARVVNFADHSLATWAANQREATIRGLDAWNAAVAQAYPGVARFALLTPEQQLAFANANQRTPFFNQMIFVTLTGTFSNPLWGGNAEGVGYRILGFEDRFFWQPPFGWYDAQANGGPN